MTVELLERALGYTRVALAGVRPGNLHRPTPCAGWDLDALLDHMHDALDAFAEAAHGTISLDPPHRALDVRLSTLQTKACALLGAWSGAGQPTTVSLGGAVVPTTVVVRAAALEIAVHGWDVARATGHPTPLPDSLASELLPVARALVDDADRGTRFAPALGVETGAGAPDRLLAFLGRSPDQGGMTGPPRHTSSVRRTQERPAS